MYPVERCEPRGSVCECVGVSVCAYLKTVFMLVLTVAARAGIEL